MNGAVQDLVIVGRDAPVWLAACVMQSALGPAGLRVTVVELPDALGAADVYATLPALEPLHARLRIEEARLISATRGAFTLGKRFQDTTGQAAAFFHAYGSTGARIDNTEFLPNWIKARHYGLPVAFEDFCLTAAAATHGRMLLPDAEIERHGFTDYGYHLPAIPYAAWLRQLALHRGVVRHESQELEVLMTPGGSDIAGVRLDDGRRVMGDFFIDATGAGSLLLAGRLAVARESWRDSFPADRILVAHAPPVSSQPIYADVRAGENGWLALHPSQACTHVIHSFSSETPNHRAIENAERLARLELQGVEIRAHDPGRRLLAWQRNCVGHRRGRLHVRSDSWCRPAGRAVRAGSSAPVVPGGFRLRRRTRRVQQEPAVGLRTHPRFPVGSLRAQPLWRRLLGAGEAYARQQ